MKKFLYSNFPAARSLAGIAHEILVETRNAANTKACVLRSQVEELWQAAGEMLPLVNSVQLIRNVEKTLKVLKNRDTISFPMHPSA